MFNELDFQKELIIEFNKRGWETISFENEFTNSAFSIAQLTYFLKQQYKDIKNFEIIEICETIKNKLNGDWYENNKLGILHFLSDGISTSKTRKNHNPSYKLIDLKLKTNNIFKIAEEVWTSQTSRQDVILLINGLPFFNFELKSFTRLERNTTIDSAIEQIKTYANDSPKFFTFNIASIALNQWSNSFLGSPLAKKEFWFSLLKDANGDIETFFDFFEFKNIKNYLSFGILFNATNLQNKKKYILRHHQIDAVLNIIPAIRNKKGGYVWHTQGSGKSITISSLLSALPSYGLASYTTVIDVDRQALAKQIFKLLKSLDEKHFSSTEIKLFKNSKELRDKLSNSKYRGIYVTTTQKFNKCELLTERNDILFISDEAHRTHSSGKLENETHTTYFKNINTSLKNAIKLGFTGTPIFSGYVKTFEMFGKMLHKYTMKDAEEDGIITKIKYTYIKTTLSCDKDKIKNIKNSKKFLKKTDVIDNAPERIKIISNEIGNIFYEKYVQFRNDNPLLVKKDVFKAMFVTNSVKSAYSFYKELKSWFLAKGGIGKELAKEIEIIVSKRDKRKRNDFQLWKELNSKNNIKLIENFKLPNSKYKIIIVKDMLLTGYDVPNLRLMFFDRYIHSHNLMQAIARVNRNYANKSYGQIISFRDITAELEDAQKTYRNTTDEDASIDISENVEKEIIQCLESLQSLGLNLSQIEDQISLNINRLAMKFKDNYKVIQKLQSIKYFFPLVYKWSSSEIKRQAELAKLLFTSMRREGYEKRIISITDEEFKNILDSIIVDKKIIRLIDEIEIQDLLNETIIDKTSSMNLILEKISKQIKKSNMITCKEKKTLIEQLKKIIIEYNNERFDKEELLYQLKKIKNETDGDPELAKILSILLATIKGVIKKDIKTKITNNANKLLRNEFANEWWLTTKSKKTRKSAIYNFLISLSINKSNAKKITDIFLDRVSQEKIIYKERI